jgi:hypothetical protein
VHLGFRSSRPPLLSGVVSVHHRFIGWRQCGVVPKRGSAWWHVRYLSSTTRRELLGALVGAYLGGVLGPWLRPAVRLADGDFFTVTITIGALVGGWALTGRLGGIAHGAVWGGLLGSIFLSNPTCSRAGLAMLAGAFVGMCCTVGRDLASRPAQKPAEPLPPQH